MPRTARPPHSTHLIALDFYVKDPRVLEAHSKAHMDKVVRLRNRRAKATSCLAAPRG